MKRMFSCLLVCAMLLALCSCAQQQTQNGTRRPGRTSESPTSSAGAASNDTSSREVSYADNGSAVTSGTFSVLSTGGGTSSMNNGVSSQVNNKPAVSTITSSPSGNTVGNQNSTVSSVSSAVSSAAPDTRYRATRTNKPADGKLKTVDILCIGDSITQGTGSPSGWRFHLYKELYQWGAAFNLVGPNKSSTDPRLPERYQGHFGIGGITIEGMTDKIKAADVDFDVAVVMIGTNNKNDSPSVIEEKYRKLLDTIVAKNPDAYIFCVQILPNSTSAAVYQTTLNEDTLPKIVADYDRVELVENPSNEYNSSMFGDAVHPNEAGNIQLAANIADGIVDRVLMLCDEGDSAYKAPVAVKSIALDRTSLSLKQEEAITLKATVSPSNAEAFTVLWSSENENVATVNSFGKVTGQAVGTTTITATSLDGNYTKTCTVNVSAAASLGTSKFVDRFASADVWSGDTDCIKSSSFQQSWTGDIKTIESKTEFAVPSNYCLALSYAVNGNELLGGTNYSSVTFGGLELRIIAGASKLELYQGKTKIGEYTAVSPNSVETTYRIYNRNGKVTVTYGGETVITANATASSKSTIALRLGDKFRVMKMKKVELFAL